MNAPLHKKILQNTLFFAAGLAFVLCFFLPDKPAYTQQSPVYIRTGSETVLAYRNSYALLIGESDYSRGWPRLQGVKADIELLSGALASHGFIVKVVMDPAKNSMDEAISAFIRNYGMEENNRLLFYFAGHGYTRKTSLGEEIGYLVPYNCPNPNKDMAGFEKTAVELALFEVYAKRIRSKHALFLFDACFSGSLFMMSHAIASPVSRSSLFPVRQFITSGSADEQVPDKSIFCEQLVAALQGEADRDKDGYLTGSELGEFLQKNVTNYSRDTQHPQYGKLRTPNLDKGDFIFIIPGPDKPVFPLSPQPVKPKSDGTGDLMIITSRAGDVYLDEMFYRNVTEGTQVILCNIPAGKYIFTLNGPRSFTCEIQIRRGETVRITIP